MIKRDEVNEILEGHLDNQQERMFGRIMPYLNDILAGDMSTIPAQELNYIKFDLAARDCVLTIKDEVAALEDFPVA